MCNVYASILNTRVCSKQNINFIMQLKLHLTGFGHGSGCICILIWGAGHFVIKCQFVIFFQDTSSVFTSTWKTNEVSKKMTKCPGKNVELA